MQTLSNVTIALLGAGFLVSVALVPLGAAYVVCRVLTSILHASIRSARRG